MAENGQNNGRSNRTENEGLASYLHEHPQKVLISSTDFGVGKSTLALSLAQHLPEEQVLLSFDYEDGQSHYVVPRREQADPARGLFYVRRLRAPTLYEVWAIVRKLRYPKATAGELSVLKAPLDWRQIGPDTKEVLRELHEGKLRVSGVIFDTITRLSDQVTAVLFEGVKETMTQLTWNKVKDDISEMLFEVIEARQHLVMTAWSKHAFDKERLRSTNEIIADVLRNIRGFVDLELMLAPNPGNRRPTSSSGGVYLPPLAEVRKSRLRPLPAGSVLASATWPAILAAQPQFSDELPAPPAAVAGGEPAPAF